MAAEERQFGVFAHGYQPGRLISLPVDGSVLQVVPIINEVIYEQCYRPLLVDSEALPQGLTFSLYGTLREWMKDAHPQEFASLVGKIQKMPDKEYQVLGDSCFHVILPLLPEEDQDMLIKMGRTAFVADLGFEPKGLWLPETAVSYGTLRSVRRNGYEFVALRDSQLLNPTNNPMYVGLSEGGEIAVMHFNSVLSGSVSFDHWATMNADNFLQYWINGNNQVVAIGSDMELYGHHQPVVGWLKHLLKPETLAAHGFKALSIKDELSKDDHSYIIPYEDSSWSCPHGLGRWTGGCDCDGASHETQGYKNYLFAQLSDANRVINEGLDGVDSGWRGEFVSVLLDLRAKVFTGEEFLTDLERMVSREKFGLFSAKIYTLIGLTSCGWFFGKSDSPEREIPETMVKVVGKILAGGQVVSDPIDKIEQFAVV